MRVLAIDPGYDRCGIAVLEYQNNREVILYSKCIETDRKAPLNDRLYQIGLDLDKIIKQHEPNTLAIETLFFNKNITTGIGVAQARGVVLYIAKQANLHIYEFGPQEVKMAVTGYGSSDKAAVYSMIKKLVDNVPIKAKDDEYDAIAIGITALAQHGRK